MTSKPPRRPLREAATIGRDYGDADLFALAAHEQGHVLIRLGRGKDGLRLLDETMVAVTAGELSPIVSGIVYCGVILACQDASELRRAQEWTAALSDWCDRQPDLVAFTGRCLTHRAELLQLHGAWAPALEAARRAEERSGGRRTRPPPERPATAAERSTARSGSSVPRRRRTGRRAETAGSLSPASPCCAPRKGKSRPPLRRSAGRWLSAPSRPAGASLLPAFAEIVLAVGDVAAARAASDELAALAAGSRGRGARGERRRVRGAVQLAEGDPAAALVSLRRAARRGARLEAPYELARVRELLGLACRALDDEDTAALELDAARATYARARRGARSRQAGSLAGGARREAHGLTARELEVLRLVAAGRPTRRSPPGSSSASARSTGT